VRALLAAVGGHRFAPIYHTLVKTGGRRDEVLAMRAEDLDLAAGLVFTTPSGSIGEPRNLSHHFKEVAAPWLHFSPEQAENPP
jgi:integrase